jgi:drug/metabolite transporter (DMT)-like permease
MTHPSSPQAASLDIDEAASASEPQAASLDIDEAASASEPPPAASPHSPHSPPSPTGTVPHPRLLPWLAFAAVCIFWGTSAPAIRYTVRTIPALSLVTVRFTTAGLILLLIAFATGHRPKLQKGLGTIVPSAIALGFTNVLVTYGFARVEGGPGCLLLATTAFSFAVVDRLWPGQKHRPGPGFWWGLVLGLCGVATLIGPPSKLLTEGLLGYLALLLSCWVWATGSIWQARHPSGLDPFSSSAVQMLLAAAMVYPIQIALGQKLPWPLPTATLVALVFLVATASLIAFVSFIYILRHLPGYAVGLYTYVNPVVAGLSSWAVLGEHLSARFFVAAAIIFASVALVQTTERRRRQGGTGHASCR